MHTRIEDGVKTVPDAKSLPTVFFLTAVAFRSPRICTFSDKFLLYNTAFES